MKLIALDVGTKRIGVAKADSKVRIAIPYNTIDVNGEEFQKLASLARAWDINNFVLGLPRSNEGNETKQSAYVRKFARELKRHIPSAKICFQDESLTSVEAEKRIKNRKKSTQKGDIDSEAAAIILQDFLEEKTGKSTTRAAAAKRQSIKAKGSHRLLSVIIALVLLVVLAGAAAIAYYSHQTQPVAAIDCAVVTADECQPTLFVVESGASISDVATTLEEDGLIRNAFVFQVYFRLNSHGESLKAGEYNFTPTMSAAQITGLLIHGADSVFSFTILPGDTIQNIRANLIEIGYPAEAVDAALARDYRNESYGWIFDGAPTGDFPAGYQPLEGYLYGETYEFYSDDSVETVIGRFLEAFAVVLKDNHLKDQFAEHGLSLYEGITLASVVQREAGLVTDMAQIAQVFYNRLGAGTLLGSDVTASYAADLVDPERTTYTDNALVLDIDSPYNTRKHAGLPFGPIANPSLAALEAVASPDSAMADYFYFLTGDDGVMYYAIDEDGHQANIAEHCQELCNLSL